MRTYGAVLLTFAACACSSAEPVYLALPSFDPAAQSLIVVQIEEVGVQVEAVEIDGWDGRIEIDPNTTRGLELLVYRERLADQGWRPGPLSLASDSDCAAAALSTPTERYRLEDLDSEPGFVSKSGLPAEFEGALFRAACPCFGFEVNAFEIQAPGRPRGIVKNALGFRLQTVGGLYELSENFEVLTANMNTSPERMYTDPDGTGWIGAEAGHVYRWPLGGVLELALTIPDIGPIERVAPGQAEGELLLVAREGLYAWSGGPVELLEPTGARQGSNQISVLVTLPSKVSIAGLYRNFGLLRRRPGGEMLEPLSWRSDLDPPQYLDFVEGYGLFLSARTNRTFLSKDEGNEWTELTPNQSDRQLANSQQFIPFEGGFLEIGRAGLRQYAPRTGYCPTLRWDEAIDMRAGLFLEDGRLLIVGDDPEGPGLVTPAYLLTPTSPVN